MARSIGQAVGWSAPQWLADRLGAPDVAVVDGSFYLPAMKRDAAAEYLAGHIPGAVRFDIDEICGSIDPAAAHAAVRANFRAAAGKLGISERDTIVVYDGAGTVFRAAGVVDVPPVRREERVHSRRRIAALEGRRIPLDAKPVRPKAAPRHSLRRSRRQIVADARTGSQHALADQSAQVVDARPADRFRGEAPEPRAGVRPGHMPGSFNVPSSAMLENGRLASPEKLKAAFHGRRRRYRQADHHQLRLGCFGRDPVAGARIPRQARPRRSTTARGPNGARAPTCPPRQEIAKIIAGGLR